MSPESRDVPAVVIPAVISIPYLVGVTLVAALGLPWWMALPIGVRLAGVALIATGFGLFAWLGRVRRFRVIVASSRATLTKFFRKGALDESLGRTEPLVVSGPYRIVRHPMYSAASMITFGLALATDLTPVLIGSGLLVLWLAFVIVPFEERELRVLFGREYEEYMRRTSRMLPLPRRVRRP